MNQWTHSPRFTEALIKVKRLTLFAAVFAAILLFSSVAFGSFFALVAAALTIVLVWLFWFVPGVAFSLASWLAGESETSFAGKGG